MRPVIGFLFKACASLSESSMLNELVTLEKQGCNLHLFSLEQLPEHAAHPSINLVKTPITYVPSLLPTFDHAQEQELISAQLSLLQQNSDIYCATLKRYLNRDNPQRFNQFLQAGYLARQMQSLHIDHIHTDLTPVCAETAKILHAFSGISYSVVTQTKDAALIQAL